MAEGFDFEKFYINEKVKTEAAIDRSGVIVQNPTESAEIVTNNVLYYAGTVQYRTTAGSAWAEVTDGCRICIEDVSASSPNYYFVRPWHLLGEVADLGIATAWKPGASRETVFEPDADADDMRYHFIDDNNGTHYSIYSFRAYIFPRHTAEANQNIRPSSNIEFGLNQYPIDQNVVRYAALMKVLYGALGLYGGRWKSLKWLSNVWDKKQADAIKDNAVISYDRFKRAMDNLADVCKDNDVGFSVTYYDQSFAREVTAEDATPDDYRINRSAAKKKHRQYIAALAAADITKTDMGKFTSFSDAYGSELASFISRTGLVDNIGSAYHNETALLPPIKTAIKAYFYQADELEDEFCNLFHKVLSEISKVPIVWKFVSATTKNTINNAKRNYISQPSGSTRMAFDLDVYQAILLNEWGKSYWQQHAVPRVIQVGGWTTGSGAGNTDIVGPNAGQGNWNIAWWSADTDANTPLYMSFSGASSKSVRDKEYVSMSAQEVLNELIDRYNAVVAAVTKQASAEDDQQYISNEVRSDITEHVISHPETFGSWAFGEGGFLNKPGVGQFGWILTNVSCWMNYVRLNGQVTNSEGTYIDAGKLVTYMVNNWPANTLFDFGQLSAAGMGFDPVLSGTYDVIAWEEGMNESDREASTGYKFVPKYTEEWLNLSELPFESFGTALKIVNAMRDAYKQMYRAAVVQAMTIGAASAAKALVKLDDIEDDLNDIRDVCNKLTWYQRLVDESPFINLSTIPDAGNSLNTSAFPAHLMFPVSMYKKVRVKYKRWGRTRHKMVKRSIGVRWAEVTFTDAAVFGEYPVVEEEAGNTVNYTSTYEIDGSDDAPVLLLDRSLPDEVVEAGRGLVRFANESVSFTVESDVRLALDGVVLANPGSILSLKIPLAPSQHDGSREPVNILYKMPGLPYDSEIRKRAFVEFGSLSQAPGFEVVRNQGPIDDMVPGWRIFHASSDSIADLRDGLGIHDKVAMLLSILKHEFGDSRVQLVETYRSMDDQAGMCSGGPESAFLSWHNYGLAAKILIMKPDGKTPLEKDDADMKRLCKVARAFTECCESGRIGPACNVIWCARLVVGPSLFDWEFLPVGVGHKDAPKFRDALISQTDPVHELGYVDVTANQYIVKSPPSTDKPYVLSTSAALANAEDRGGHKFMNPDNIRNYPHVDDIVLYDAKEFVNLIRLKMNANGTAMPKSGSIYDWKALNPHSCEQLIRYYAMVGSISGAKALIAGDYVERYLPVEEQYYNTSAIDYVKGMLGNHYKDVRICVARDGESAYITLHDGIFHVKALDAYPNNEPTRFDVHKQQKVDKEHMLWGTWHDGVFYTEDEWPVPYIDSDRPVLSGYVDGEAVDGEALMLHYVLAAKIHKKFTEIRKLFEEFRGSLMYDHVEDGPNAGMADMLENEFGLIKAQDLLDFDELDTIVSGILDNAALDDRGTGMNFGLGKERVKLDGSIYEKVVNNAQVAGIRRASLNKEHIHIKDNPTPSAVKTLYDLMAKGNGYMANDII